MKTCANPITVTRIFPHGLMGFTFCETLLQIFLTPLYYHMSKFFLPLFRDTCCHVWTKVFKFYLYIFFPFVKKNLNSFLGLFPFLLFYVQLLLFLGCARNCKRYHLLLFVDLHSYENVFCRLSTEISKFYIFPVFPWIVSAAKNQFMK